MRAPRFAFATSAWLVLDLAATVAVGRASAIDDVVWERNRNWAPSGETYLDGATCDVEGTAPCPREMGWQGRELAWAFELPEGGLATEHLRFELTVSRVLRALEIEVLAGAAGAIPVTVGTLIVDAPAVHRVLVPAARFRAGAGNRVVLRGDHAVGFGEPAGIVWISAGLYRRWPEAPDVSDEDLLDDTQWRACRYFHEQAFPNGLVLDTVGAEAASIAATGFGATALSILAARHAPGSRWTVTPEAARAQVARMMDAVLTIQSRQASSPEEWGTAGLPYHFVDAAGRRARRSEVSTVDAALLAAGLLQAGERFGGELRDKARAIHAAMDFRRFLRPDRARYGHGWSPESGDLAAEWDRPGDETLLVCLLSLAQDPDDPERLRACYGYPRVVESYRGIPVVRSYFGSLFTYTFAHFWIPFECLGRDRPAAAGSPLPAADWWDNSRKAVEANRRFHLDRLATYPALGADAWGASACYRADGSGYFGANGAEPAEADVSFDGTLPPHGAVMSIFLSKTDDDEVLRDNPAFRALRSYHGLRLADLWTSYGPRSSYDHLGDVSTMTVGIEKGPEALGIEAYRGGAASRDLLSVPGVRAALARVFERDGCPPRPAPFVRGRVNPDAEVDISDPVYLLDHLFRGGPAPACGDAADANDDGALDVSDAIYLFSWLFLGSAPPALPFPEQGLDPTIDDLAPCAE